MTPSTPAELEQQIRAGLRLAPTAGLIGAFVCMAASMTIVMSATRNVPDRVAAVVLAVSVGYSLGSAIPAFEVVRRTRQLLGGWSTSVERMGRAIAGSRQGLSADEADRARRWAALAPLWLWLALVRHAVLDVGLVLGAVLLAVAHPSIGLGVFVLVALVILALTFLQRLQRLRRARALAARISADGLVTH